MNGSNTPGTQNGRMCLGSLGIRDVLVGDRFLCIRDARMRVDGELVYKKGEFYKSEKDGCITDRTGRIEHYWEDTDFNGRAEDYASEGFDWTDDGDLLSETLKMLLCKYANH